MAIDISNRPDRPVRKFTIPQKSVGGITSDLLKLIAIIAMVIDHVAWAFVPFESFWGQAMHIIGRLTAPIMCFMVAEGYHKTRNVKKYAVRLGVFAVISHFPFVFFETGELQIIHSTSVMFPLFLGLVALIINDSPKYEYMVKQMIITIICLVAMLGDWSCIAVLWIVFFSRYRYSRREQLKYFCIISAIEVVICIVAGGLNGLFQLGVFLAVPLLSRYNGVRKGGKGYQWFFYIFYPAHLLLLGILNIVILK